MLTIRIMLKLVHSLAIAAALALAGCAAPDGPYPSLAMRGSERVAGMMAGTMAAPPPRPYEPPQVPASDLARGDQLVSQAKSAHQGFLDAAPAARDLVLAARGASRDSEGWSRAQIAIADLESSRAQVMIALADLDRLAVDAAVAGEQFAPLGQKRDEVAAFANGETELINALLESLAQ